VTVQVQVQTLFYCKPNHNIQCIIGPTFYRDTRLQRSFNVWTHKATACEANLLSNIITYDTRVWLEHIFCSCM